MKVKLNEHMQEHQKSLISAKDERPSTLDIVIQEEYGT